MLPLDERRTALVRRLRFAVALLAIASSGCGRVGYRFRADREVYGIERERNNDPRWKLPERLVEAAPESRMRDPNDPDASPIPPDEPAARAFQVSAGRSHEFHGWDRRGAAPIEDLSWRLKLPTDSEGAVVLKQDTVVKLGLMHSRDYQDQVEDVYLSALALTLARFEFAVQWFAGQNTAYNHFGTNRNQLNLLTDDGFRKNFLSGGQLVVDFANSLVFEFSGGGPANLASSNLLVAVTQPLLRGAFARIRTQPLSLLERGVLYRIRDFARFRRGFYVDLVGQGGYLGLVNQLQGIRNNENNLVSLGRNLEEYEALVLTGLITPLLRDQVAQQYQQTQFGLISARAGLQTSLDLYKTGLGLPPDLPVRLDDSLLREFELNDERFESLRYRNDKLYLSLLQSNTPSRELLTQTATEVSRELRELETLLNNVVVEHRAWLERLEKRAEEFKDRPETDDLVIGQRRQAGLAADIRNVLNESRLLISDNLEQARKFLEGLPGTDLNDPTTVETVLRSIRDLIGKELRARFTEIYVSQTQIRVFLIDLTPVDLTLDEALSIALANRLDLMNDQARVTDAWRDVEVAANGLRGVLNVNYETNLATDPRRDEIFRFDASESRHRVGLEFDAPVNRLAERNRYRAGQIAFQRARRRYMQTHDTVLTQIRADVRQLNLSRRQFEIGREQLIIASRQVEQAEYNLRSSVGGDAGTQSLALNLLDSLNGLLNAKNSLIGSWVAYETARMSLFRDFDIMDINAEGVWTNERDAAAGFGRFSPVEGFGPESDLLGSGTEPVR